MLYENKTLKTNPNVYGSICKLYFKTHILSATPWSKFPTSSGTIEDYGDASQPFLEITPAVYSCLYSENWADTDAGRICNSEIMLKLHGLDAATINALQGWLYKRCLVIFERPGGQMRIMGDENTGCEITTEEIIGANPMEFANNTLRISWQSAEKPRVFTGEVFP